MHCIGRLERFQPVPTLTPKLPQWRPTGSRHAKTKWQAVLCTNCGFLRKHRTESRRNTRFFALHNAQTRMSSCCARDAMC